MLKGERKSKLLWLELESENKKSRKSLQRLEQAMQYKIDAEMYAMELEQAKRLIWHALIDKHHSYHPMT